MFAGFGVEAPLSYLVGESDSGGRSLVAQAVQAGVEKGEKRRAG